MTRMRHPPRPTLQLLVGVTGHRPPVLGPEAASWAEPRIGAVLAALADAVRAVGERHATVFAEEPVVARLVSPLAEGTDQIAARAALDQGYRLDAILPLPREDYFRDFDPVAQASLDSLLARTDHLLELPPQPEGREEGYALAGRATVAHCDVLVALWDGKPARGPGGTADIVALALRRGLPVVHLPLDGEARILWTGFDAFIDPADMEAMPARRADAAGLAELAETLYAPPKDRREAQALETYLHERERLVRPRVEYPLLLTLIGVKRFRRRAFLEAPYAGATREEWQRFLERCNDGRHGVAASLDRIESAYGWADRLAQNFAQSYRSGHILNFVLGALAVLIALSGLLFPAIEFWAALCELIAIAGFVLNTTVGSGRQWHRRWLEYRQLAERIRPMRSLKLLGVAAPSHEAAGPGGANGRWVSWYAAAVWREARIPVGRMMPDGALAKVIAEEELRSQIEYHRANAQQMYKLDHRLHRIGMFLFSLSFLSCLCSVTANLVDHHFAEAHAHLFISLSAGLPALGAAVFGIRMQGDFGATAARSLSTAQKLERIVEAMDRPSTGLARQAELVEAAAAAMYGELDDWHRAYAQRRLELP